MSEHKQRLIASGASAAVISLFILSMLGSAGIAFAADIPSDAEIPDQGEFWSLKIYMMFNGSDAESIEWDFGDGSAVSTEWNPSHTYAEPGDYIVTQTVWNSYNGGSSAVTYYLLHVMGNPYVEYVMPAGAPAMDRVYVETHGTAVQPADPIWEGHDFLGWYADEELTVPLVWPEDLTAPLMAYASWSDAEPVVTHTLTIRGTDGTTVKTITVSDGATAVKPTAPEGKTVTYYADEELTVEFDWSAPVTSDLIVYRLIEDAVPVDPTDPAEDKQTVSINGTELVLIVVSIILVLAAIVWKPSIAVVALVLMAIAAVGVLDIVDLPELIDGFAGVKV
jgi:PKD repeat protein